MKKLFILLLSIGIIAMGACKTKQKTHTETDKSSMNLSTSSHLVADNNAFAFDLYKKINPDNTNCFYSPFSISAAMAMTYAGAKESTSTQMATVMRFPDNKAPFYSEYKDYLEKLKLYNNENTIMGIANSIWAQQDYKFKKEFFAIIKDYFLSEINNLDFKKDPEGSRKQINQWVENKTNQKIKYLIQQGMIDDLTRLVLVNAIYFKAAWSMPFDKNNTKKMNFNISSNNPVSVDYMVAENMYKFYDDTELSAIEIPYSNNNLSMLIVMPKAYEGLGVLKNNIGIGFYNKINSQTVNQTVKLMMPKFTINSEYELSKIFKDMGMTEAFSDRADFSDMTVSPKELKISKVVHKTFIATDEAGTEAAASTAVIMRIKSAPVQVKEFKIDRPFLFVIKDNANGSILFMGNIYNPAK
jgi:serpin B